MHDVSRGGIPADFLHETLAVALSSAVAMRLHWSLDAILLSTERAGGAGPRAVEPRSPFGSGKPCNHVIKKDGRQPGLCIFAKGHRRDHGDTLEHEMITWRMRASTTHSERLPRDRVVPKKRKLIDGADDDTADALGWV